MINFSYLQMYIFCNEELDRKVWAESHAFMQTLIFDFRSKLSVTLKIDYLRRLLIQLFLFWDG